MQKDPLHHTQSTGAQMSYLIRAIGSGPSLPPNIMKFARKGHNHSLLESPKEEVMIHKQWQHKNGKFTITDIRTRKKSQQGMLRKNGQQINTDGGEVVDKSGMVFPHPAYWALDWNKPSFLFVLVVSADPNVCSGKLPHASLEPYCIQNPRETLCDYKCNHGYRYSDVEDVMFGYRNSEKGKGKDVLCLDGVWITYILSDGIGIHDLCLPEGMYFWNRPCQGKMSQQVHTAEARLFQRWSHILEVESM